MSTKLPDSKIDTILMKLPDETGKGGEFSQKETRMLSVYVRSNVSAQGHIDFFVLFFV